MDGAPVDAPATEVATPDHAAALPPETVTALLTTFLEATNRQDATALTAILTPDFRHHWPFGHETVGVAEYLAQLERVAAVFPDLTVTANQTFPGDGFGAMVWTAIGTQRQPFLGFPPSEHSATWSGLFVHRLAGNQIAETWTQADHLSRLQQQGALPPAPHS